MTKYHKIIVGSTFKKSKYHIMLWLKRTLKVSKAWFTPARDYCIVLTTVQTMPRILTPSPEQPLSSETILTFTTDESRGQSPGPNPILFGSVIQNFKVFDKNSIEGLNKFGYILNNVACSNIEMGTKGFYLLRVYTFQT